MKLVFKHDLKMSTEGEDLIWRGRTFLSLGAISEHALSPLDFNREFGTMVAGLPKGSRCRVGMKEYANILWSEKMQGLKNKQQDFILVSESHQ